MWFWNLCMTCIWLTLKGRIKFKPWWYIKHLLMLCKSGIGAVCVRRWSPHACIKSSFDSTWPDQCCYFESWLPPLTLLNIEPNNDHMKLSEAWIENASLLKAFQHRPLCCHLVDKHMKCSVKLQIKLLQLRLYITYYNLYNYMYSVLCRF